MCIRSAVDVVEKVRPYQGVTNRTNRYKEMPVGFVSLSEMLTVAVFDPVKSRCHSLSASAERVVIYSHTFSTTTVLLVDLYKILNKREGL